MSAADAMPRQVLSVQDLHVSYGAREVIKSVSFTICEGQVLAVAGPNGAGKTTLVRAILGLMPVTSGTIKLDAPAHRDPEARVAYIPQRLEVDRTFPISLKEMLGLSVADLGQMQRYVNLLDLGGLLDRMVGELSGGQMQRALLAYAALKEPSLLVMDEPTSWVDARGADCILCIIEEFKRRGMAMLVVTHDVESFKAVSTHILGLSPTGQHFFEPSGSKTLERLMHGLNASTHQHGGAGAQCGHLGCMDSCRKLTLRK